MKMAKKVLSVVLAVLMALSCFAVAASAWGTAGSERNVKVTLNVAVAEDSPVWTKSGTKVTGCNAGGEDLEYEGVSSVTANPGDTVWVYETVSTDYYVWCYSAQIFYSAALIDAFTDYKAQTGKTSMTATHETLVHQWNTEGNIVATYGTAAMTQAPWGKITDTNKKDIAKAWPTDESGVILAAYTADETPTSTSTADMTKWAWARHSIAVNGQSDSGLVWEPEEGEWLFRFPVKIPADATAGTTYTITIPDEGMVKRSKKSTSIMYCSEMGEEGAIDGANELKAVWNYPTDAKSGEQYWDLSDATCTITVAGNTLDYTALNTAIATAKAKNLTGAISGATELAAAITSAEALVNNASSQTQINDMVTTLNNAIAAVVYGADYTALDAAIALAGTKAAKDYTTASYNAMTAKLADANAILRGQAASYQSTIDAATLALNNAINALVAEGAANKTALNAAIATATGLVAANYTAESYAGIAAPLATAQGLAADATLNAKDQSAIDNATNALNAAIGALVEADADYTALNNLLAEVALLNADDYTAGSWAVLADAVTAANAIDKNLKKKDQATIDNAKDAVANAKAALVTLGNANYTALDAAIADVPAYAQSYYTEATWSAYATALANANAVDRNLKSTAQGTVDTATTNLVNAKAALALKDADYSAVTAAAGRVDPASAEAIALYTPESLAAFTNAINAVVYGKKINEQDAVNAMAAAINAVVLEYKAANTQPLTDAIAAANAINSANYTTDSYNALAAKVSDGQALLATDLDVRDNAAIQAAADAITAKIGELVALGADYTALEAAKARFTGLTVANYTAESYAAAQAAYDAAAAVPAGLDITHNDEIAAKAADLDAAIDALVEADANYTAVDAALATVPTVWTKSYTSKLGDKSKYTFNIYTADSKAAVDNAVAAVVRGKKAAEQADVDAMATAINNAVSGLQYADLDYASYADQFANPVIAAKDTYTTASYNTFKAAYDALAGKSMSAWTTAGKALTAFDNAYLALEAAPTVSYSALQNKYDEVKNADLTNVIVGKDAFVAALGNAEAMLQAQNATSQSEVDALVTALADTYAALKNKANYTALEAALATAANVDANAYTAASYATYADAVAAGNAVDKNLTTDDQATIDNAVAAINNAYAGLEAKADYTALDAAIADAANVNADNYTAASYATYADAVAAGNNVDRTLGASAQQTIDNATAAIVNAKAALEAKANYTALDEALAAAAAYTDGSAYTTTSWNALVNAVAAGNNVDRALGAKSQKTIDDAAAAITAAIAGLREKTPEDELGHAKSVEYTPAKGNKNTYDVKVEGRAMMVQFYENETGSTNSYDRYSTSNVTIKSYNAKGEEINSMNVREIAYEIWSVTTVMGEGEITVRAKGNGESRWESLDNNLYTFENVRVAPDANLVSVDAAESGKLGAFPMTITVGPDATRVQVKMDDGSTNTTSALTDDGNGNLTCTIKGYANHEGENVITIRVLTADAGWITVGTYNYTASK